jgi:hypothetical protein
MKYILIATVCALASVPMLGQLPSHSSLKPASGPALPGNGSELPTVTGALVQLNPEPPSNRQHVGVASDWTQHYVRFSTPKNAAVKAKFAHDPRYMQFWYLHHRSVWWPGVPHGHLKQASKIQRDWNVSLGTVTFGPIIDGGTGKTDPGGGIAFPAKYTFDVTAVPNCTSDYVAMGLPATPESGGQANIVGYNNLYSGTDPISGDPNGYCAGLTGPTTMFAYASGTGEVPASISLSQDGKKLAYVEDLTSGSSYFHVLTIGTSGSNGASATSAAVPGVGNNAVDQTVLLSPDGGVTNQSSTTSPFIDYTTDSAYVTSYTFTPYAQGYVYKISPVFGGGTPAIVWSTLFDCSSGGPPGAPSSPVFDGGSNNVLFTDTGAGSRISYFTDHGGSTPPTVTCGTVGNYANTAANPPVVDPVNTLAYATYNSNGSNQYVAEVESENPTGGSLGLSVGGANTTYTGPYNVDFSNDYYNCDLAVSPCAGNPMLYVAGKDAGGTVPTLYTEGFTSDLGIQGDFGTPPSTTPLATGPADSSPVTEFFNDPDGVPADGTDYLFVGVTNNCAATNAGGIGGCVMSLNITGGAAPSVSASTTAIPAAGGPTGMVIDNDSIDSQASSIYYATRTGGTLVKATQSGLN